MDKSLVKDLKRAVRAALREAENHKIIEITFKVEEVDYGNRF